VFHLGACSATTERNASYLIDNNFEYTKELARWAVSTGARFIYASSAATYGDGSRGMDDRLADLSQLRPLNMYGYSKHLFDLWADREGLLNRIVGVKYFNVFGPNEDHKGEMRSLVHKAFQQIQSTGIVQLFRSHRPDFRDGEQQRDFLYVKDAVEMTLGDCQLWDCFSARPIVHVFDFLRDHRCIAYTRSGSQNGRYLFTVDFCADGMDSDTGFTEQAEEHKSFNFIRLDNGQFATQPNNRCLWYDQSLIPADVKFPDFQAAKDFYTVDGTRKWSAGDDWFYSIEEKTA
jgi:hypothetical protein